MNPIALRRIERTNYLLGAGLIAGVAALGAALADGGVQRVERVLRGGERGGRGPTI